MSDLTQEAESYRKHLMQRHIAFLRGELFESRRDRFDEWATDKTLEEQVEFLVKDAMKSYVEPDILKPREAEEAKPVKRIVRAPDRSNPDER